ncbi:hypothetical protein [Streptomyces sp. NRRL S-1868]|uniref:hypothetical protein n=1 Tax=Streptomyces sp. NRRL S-1868 TaxID=1463892 RepID=UPI0004C609E0|nr:hypothetical protein [Streptomyces sp. NRRL S-1868]
MTTRHLRAALLLAAVPLAAAMAAAALKAGHWRLYADRHRIELKPQPRRSCPDCRGAGGWWTNRRELRVRLLPIPAWPDEPPL